MPDDLLGVDPAQVPHARPAIALRVGVEHLAPPPGERQADPVIGLRVAGEVRDARHHRRLALGVDPVAQEAQDVAARVVGVDPGEALGGDVTRPHRGHGAVSPVEVADQRLDPAVQRVLEQVPVERPLLGPLAFLPELAALEQQLLARVRPHVGQQRAQVRGLVPGVAGHPLPQRALAVHHLVVREREHEVLAEGVHQREGHLVVVVAAVDGVAPDVVERVVHPAHVPLEAEAQAAEVRGPRDARPGRRLLGDRDDSREVPVDRRVHLLQERHRVEVLPAAVDVRQPLPLGAGVVQVEHRGDGVDAQPVDVELVEPVQRVGDEEVAHLLAAEVEHERAPVGLLAPARVCVLVQRCAVELRQCPLVAREVRGHPVDDHAVAVLVQVVDEPAEVVGGAEPRGRRVVRGDLVAPRPAERVLGDRQQLDVGEAGLVEVVDELLGHLAVAQPRPPRAEVHLVDAHRLGVGLALRAGGHPLLVGPLVGGDVHDGPRGGRDLGAERHRVGLVAPAAVGPEDPVLVADTRRDARDEQLPDAGAAEHPHGVRPAGPAVEVAGDADAVRGGRPNREAGAGDRARRGVVGAHVGAQDVPQALVAALADQVQVDLAERRQPAVGVIDDVDAVAVAHREPVVRGRPGHDPGEQPGVVHLHQRIALATDPHHVHLVGVRTQDAHDRAVFVGVRTEYRMGVVMRTAEQPVDGLRVRRRGIDRLGQVIVAIHAGTLLLPA